MIEQIILLEKNWHLVLLVEEFNKLYFECYLMVLNDIFSLIMTLLY